MCRFCALPALGARCVRPRSPRSASRRPHLRTRAGPGSEDAVRIASSAARPSLGRGGRPVAFSPAVKNGGLREPEAAGPRVSWRVAQGRHPDATRSLGCGSHYGGRWASPRGRLGAGGVSAAERATGPGRGRVDPLLAANSDPIRSACGLRWRPPTHPPPSPKLRRGVWASCRRRRPEGGQQPLELPPKPPPEPEERVAAGVPRFFPACAPPCGSDGFRRGRKGKGGWPAPHHADLETIRKVLNELVSIHFVHFQNSQAVDDSRGKLPRAGRLRAPAARSRSGSGRAARPLPRRA